MISTLCRDERGATAIEFAFIAPVLLVMLAGILEYGRVLGARQSIRDIIDMNARRGVAEVLATSAVQEAVEADLEQIPTVQDYFVTVTDGANLIVSVNASYNLVLGAFLPENLLSFQMTTTLRR
jgi:Flp pilus assembly protein TadG